MRILVLGAGEVGREVARLLSSEDHDVTVVDQEAEALTFISSRLDVLTVQGNGTSVDVLREAGIEETDMMIAVTSVDEVNIIACMMAARMGVETTIARIRSGDFTGRGSVLKATDLGISLVIHPEESTANDIVRLLRRASATDVLQLADGRMLLMGLRVMPESSIVGRRLSELDEVMPDFAFRIAGISRGIRTILPRGNERVVQNDQIFLLAASEDCSRIVREMGHREAQIRDVMIFGGSSVGANAAHQLSQNRKMRVKLIEPDRERAEHLAEQLPDVLVIHGAASDLDIAVAEGIAEMDAFVAIRDDEASNLVSCLMAKHLGVHKTVALLSNAAYVPISQRIGIDAAVNMKLSVSKEILRFLRGNHVLSVATVHGLNAEVLELRAEAGSKVTKSPLRKLSIPHGVLLGARVSDHEIEIATGETQVEAGDRVIVFALPKRVKEIEKMFSVV
ncbi:MAG: Trk system potassium transporter TrkA [Bacteroidota bacterium]